MTARYSLGVRVIHWLTVALVSVQLLLALSNILFYEPRPILAEWLVQVHISCGAMIFCLTLVRLLVRVRSYEPERAGRAMVHAAARGVQSVLYLCLLVLPVSGYLKLAALGFPIVVLGVLPLPTMGLNVPLARAAADAHWYLSCLLLGLLSVHVLAALCHRRIDGRAVMPHMSLRRAR